MATTEERVIPVPNDQPPRPEPLDFRPEPVPDTLRDREQWVAWRYKFDTDRDEWTKVPIDVTTGRFAKSTDPDTWASFDDALEYHRRNDTDTDGLGFVVCDDDLLVGIDLDNCREPDTGTCESWADELLEAIPTYTEPSPSGTGFRLFGLGFVPDGGTRADIDGADGHLEMYETGRYLTVTGHAVDGSPDEVEQVNDEIADIHAQYIIDDEPEPETPKAASDGGVQAGSSGANPGVDGLKPRSGDITNDLTDDELLERAEAAENGDKFARLWNGDTSGYESHSEADLALCGLLAFWTGGDRDQIDRLFRQSGLYRKKWDEDRGDQTYGERTIDKALEGRTDFYGPSNSDRSSSATDDDLDIPAPDAFDVRHGGYYKFHPSRDGDGNGYYERVTNFQLELLARLIHNDGRREFHLRVHPADGEPYLVDVEPSSFNELRTFRRDVLEGWSVTFAGGQKRLNQLKEFVAGQEAPVRRGTKQIGLHGDEFVTPEGSLTADGWADDPDVIYTDESSQLIPLWQLTPDTTDPDDIDLDAVAEILELLPQTRDPERFLPVLGWFYAAPLRPLIQDWEDEFNLLNVLGDTGAGKTATLEAMWQLFGMDGELLTAESTPFTMLTALASTNALPIVFDEYKPADMNPNRKDKLHRYLRTSTKGGIESKGNADRTTDNYHLNAPVCLAGEQPIQGPAEERRAIMTTFTRSVVVGDTPQSHAFARLIGGKAGDEYHDGLPLKDHALAFYTWLLKQETDELRDLWRESRERVIELLDGQEFDADVLDDMVVQGFQTVRFGCTIFRAFAADHGVNPDATPVTPTTIDDAILYVAGEGSGADHVSHLDRFVGLLGRAASADYLEPGEHYTVIDDGVNGTRELRVKLPTAFDQVRRYARDHDVQGEDLLDSVNDYRARIRDNAERADGYVTTTSQNTRLNETTQTRCIGIDVTIADATIDEFELGMFIDDAGNDSTRQDREQSSPTIDDLRPGYATFEATIKSILDPKPWLQGEGTLRDRTGLLDYVIRDGSGDVPRLEKGERYRFENARVTTSEDDERLIEIRPGATTVKPVTKQTGLDRDRYDDDSDHDDDGGAGDGPNPGEIDDEAAPDAGTHAPDEDGQTADPISPSGEYDGVQANVMDTLRRNNGEVSIAQLAGAIGNSDTSPDDVRSAVDRLETKGRVITDDVDGRTVVRL